MSIITKNGDYGNTSLFGGAQLPKHHPRLEAYGTVDEASSAIGMIRACGKIPENLANIFVRIQNELFTVGSDLAAPDPETKVPRVTSSMIEGLERDCMELESELPELKSFILPAGGEAASRCFLARAIVRRAERHVSALLEEDERTQTVLVYLNRLGDLLFVMARMLNRIAEIPEDTWSGKDGE